jgi:hypothetical protein
MLKQPPIRRKNFIATERESQANFFAHSISLDMIHDVSPHRLKAGQRLLNLAPSIRKSAESYFGPPRNIAWHQHANHGLSSQACCLNFLMPLATQPEVLAKVIGNALGIEGITMLPIEYTEGQEPCYVAFEWIGGENYLSEWPVTGKPTRGANVTSADAAVRFQHNGKIETVLIEWKYTERYGAPLASKGNATRIGRYADKMLAPSGPIRADLDLKLEDFLWEPLYQMVRQQMLAWRMEQAHEMGADRVTVLHISPRGNTDLRKITSPTLAQRFQEDVFSVFRSLLVRPDTFVSKTREEVFDSFLAAEHASLAAQDWAIYLRERY